MPGMDGVSVLEEAKRIAPDVPFIIVTAHGTVETAVGAMKKGAYDFIIKPFKLEELEALVERALDHPVGGRGRGLERRDAGRLPDPRAGGPERRDGADLRRERHGQGGRGAHAPRLSSGARRRSCA
jgi:DNA-binding response OmpR family regulator